MNVLIVGAGAIGLQQARLLGIAGCNVTLVERAQVGREASWAGGGIVSPLYPWRYAPAITALSKWSQEAYPALGEALIESTGLDPQVYPTGLYWLDLEDESEALAWAQAQQAPLQSVAMDQVMQAVPVLGSGYSRALFMPGVANVRNPRLLQALKASLALLPNVRLLENTPVASLIQEAGKVTGVQTAEGPLWADQVVIAAGAWSAELLEGVGLQLPIKPMKGQMLLYRCAEDFLSCIVMADGRYAIPRRDGHILVGSTLEDVGFDKQPSEDARQSLQASAEQLLPALAGIEPIRHWAGLRPGSPEGIPFIGAVPGAEGLWLNCGHFRNGLVLAPASCQLLTDLLLQRAPLIDPTPYIPPAV